MSLLSSDLTIPGQGAKIESPRKAPMSKPCVVLATFTPRLEHYDKVKGVLLDVIPDVHQEPGCELYALHEETGGHLVLIEKWTSRELWQEHLTLDTVARIRAGVEGALARETEVFELYGIPSGELTKGSLA